MSDNLPIKTGTALAKPDTALSNEAMIALDAGPFADMAALFGAASTVLSMLQQSGRPYATAAEVLAKIRQCFSIKGDEFCQRVMAIILQYFANHPDQSCWEKVVKAYKRLCDSGFSGMRSDAHQIAVACGGEEDVEHELVRTFYSHLL